MAGDAVSLKNDAAPTMMTGVDTKTLMEQYEKNKAISETINARCRSKQGAQRDGPVIYDPDLRMHVDFNTYEFVYKGIMGHEQIVTNWFEMLRCHKPEESSAVAVSANCLVCLNPVLPTVPADIRSLGYCSENVSNMI